MVKLIEGIRDYIVVVNELPFYRSEVWNRENNIRRTYGKNGEIEKINTVYYPKKRYTKKYLMEKVLSQYDNCPLCIVGKEIQPKKKSLEIMKQSNLIKKMTPYLIFGGIISIPFLFFGIKRLYPAVTPYG